MKALVQEVEEVSGSVRASGHRRNRGGQGTGGTADSPESPRAQRPLSISTVRRFPVTTCSSRRSSDMKRSIYRSIGTQTGRLELADGGTLFWMKSGICHWRVRARFYVHWKPRPLSGWGNQKIRVDIAIIAATNKDLHQAVQEGLFRQDLLYRLDIIRFGYHRCGSVWRTSSAGSLLSGVIQQEISLQTHPD